MADRDDCLFAISMAAGPVLAALDPNAVLVAGCDVRKQPDACPDCALNNDCSRIPLHDNCHCEAETYILGAAG